MSFKRTIPWISQPQTPVKVSSRFADSLVHALNGALASPKHIYDSAQQKLLVIQAASANLTEAAHLGVGKYGKFVKADRSPNAVDGGEIVLGSKLSEYASLDQYTIVAHLRRTVDIQTGVIGTGFGAAVAAGATQIQWWSDNNHYFDIQDETDRVAYTDTDAGDLVRAWTWDGAANRKIIYKNGVAVVENTAETGALSGAHTYVAMGNGLGCYSFLVFNKVLDKGTVKSLCDNPWQVFEPLKRNIYVEAAGGVTEAEALSTGTSTAAGVSGATAGSVGSSAGIATASGVAAVVAQSVASSAGAAVVSGSSGTVLASVASSAGTSTASADAENAATAATIIEATASAAGSSSASGSSGAIAGVVANASGAASADGVSGATVGTVGSASGQATSSGVGADGAVLEVVSANPFSQEVEIRKFYMRKGKKLLMFDSVAEAEAYTEAEALADEEIATAHKTSRLARKRLRTRITADALPAQTIDTDWLAGMMQRFAINLDLPTLLAEQDYERVMEIHAIAKAMQDDEDDVELLLLWG